MRRWFPAPLYMLAAYSAFGCAGRSLHVEIPQQQLPASFDDAPAGPSIASSTWSTFFADDRLKALIAAALESSPDLNIARQRIEVARAQTRRSTGALLPQVSGGVGVGVVKPSRYTAEGSGNATTDITPGRATPNPLLDYGLGLESTWEIDAWGKLRNLRDSAVARYLASTAGAQLVTMAIVTDIAASYFELVALDHTRDVLSQTVSRQEQAASVVGFQKEAGRANELAVQQFAAQLARTRALKAALTARITENENRINLLIGRYPQTVARDRGALEKSVPSRLSTGIPSELLRNRPDIREAELLLEATKCDLRAARAAFFPSITIGAGIGLQAFNPRYLLSVPESIVYSGIASLVAPLVNRSAIEADFDAAKAEQTEAMYNYQRAILSAYVEVANATSALASDAQVVDLKQQQQAHVERAVEAAGVLHRAGKATYLEVLVAQQSALEAQLELVEARRDQHLTSVRVFRALGGGWR